MLTQLHLDRTDKKIIAVSEQDVEPFLDNNKALRAVEQKSDWGREIADIPNVIAVRWFNEEHARGNNTLRMFSKEWKELVAKKLQDPDWSYLRTDCRNSTIGYR